MEDSFEVWYRREHPLLLGACVALCGDLEVAREATDEALTLALERWPSVRIMAAPGGWAQTVALNRVRRILRRRRFCPRLDAPTTVSYDNGLYDATTGNGLGGGTAGSPLP